MKHHNALEHATLTYHNSKSVVIDAPILSALTYHRQPTIYTGTLSTTVFAYPQPLPPLAYFETPPRRLPLERAFSCRARHLHRLELLWRVSLHSHKSLPSPSANYTATSNSSPSSTLPYSANICAALSLSSQVPILVSSINIIVPPARL